MRTYKTPAGSPTIGEVCLACNVVVVQDDIMVLVPLGPGDDET